MTSRGQCPRGCVLHPPLQEILYPRLGPLYKIVALLVVVDYNYYIRPRPNYISISIT